MKSTLTHAVAPEAFLVGGTLQIVLALGQAHGVAAGVARSTVAIAGHRHPDALLCGVASEALRAVALFQVVLNHALGILTTGLWLQAGIEALSTLAHLRRSTLGVQNTSS